MMQRPTEKEIQILQVIWEKKEASVKDVHEALGGETANGYTTILKLMQIMFEKGLLTRQKHGKQHLYKAALNPDKTKHQIVGKMLHGVFKGSAAQLVMSVLGQSKPTQQELKEIRDYLDKLEGGTK